FLALAGDGVAGNPSGTGPARRGSRPFAAAHRPAARGAGDGHPPAPGPGTVVLRPGTHGGGAMMPSTTPAPLHQWLAEPLPRDVTLALERLARTDDVRHIAVMPDVHLSHDVCTGTVLATERRLYPQAV